MSAFMDNLCAHIDRARTAEEIEVHSNTVTFLLPLGGEDVLAYEVSRIAHATNYDEDSDTNFTTELAKPIYRIQAVVESPQDGPPKQILYKSLRKNRPTRVLRRDRQYLFDIQTDKFPGGGDIVEVLQGLWLEGATKSLEYALRRTTQE